MEIAGDGSGDATEAATWARLAGLGLRRAEPTTCQRRGPSVRLAPVRHAFTHVRATYHPVVLPCATEALAAAESALVVHVDDLAGLALPVAQQKIGDQLAEVL